MEKLNEGFISVMWIDDIRLSKVVIFGAGKSGVMLSKILTANNVKVICCFDNNENLWGKYLWGEKIIITKPQHLGTGISVITGLYRNDLYNSIKGQTEKLGYKIIRIPWIEINKCVELLPDREYLELEWKLRFGKEIDIDNPRTFNEKLQWLKLYDRRESYIIFADKYMAKKYVGDMIGKEHIIPLIDTWNNANDIDFNKLPSKFVLKCNHNSGGGMFICNNKFEINQKFVREELNSELKKDYYLVHREWSYKIEKHLIIAEELLEDYSTNNKNGSLINYNFYCFNGEPRFLYVRIDDISGGSKGQAYLSFKKLDWSKAPFCRSDHLEMSFDVKRPSNFSEMIDIARTLSKGFPFVRCDLYCVRGKIFFSEMTFYPGGGYGKFEPEEWEEKMGEWINLPC